MKNESIKLKVLTLTLAIIMLLSMSGFTYSDHPYKNSFSEFSPTKKQLECKPRKELGSNFTNSELKNLVNEKVITQLQADKITAFIKKKDEERKAEVDKLKNMSKEDREKYIKEHLWGRSGLLSELVASDIITKEQANTIKTKLHEKYRSRIQEVLKTEVSKGTINQEQLNKINKFMDKKQEERKAKLANIKGMSETERTPHFAEKHRKRTKLMKDLVSEGIITKEQKDALEKAFKEDHKNNRGN